MRKNSPRKWLHAILDLLPVIILPIFALAVRSDNNFQPMNVEVPNVEKVKYSQIVKTSLTKDTQSEFTNIKWYDYQINIDHVNNSTLSEYPRVYGIGDFEIGHKYYFRAIPINNYGALGGRYLDSNNQTQGYFTPYGSIITATYPKFDLYANFPVNSSSYHMSFYLNIFDLTYMYGSGNEPTIQEFNTSYTDNYYNYGLNTYYLLKNGTTTYSDTDVGSQMVYTLYNATDKYFNMNSVFNLNSVWSWVQLNIFSGNVPLIAYVIWQIIIYEFIVDILFIFYSFFMFLIDFCEYLLEKPFNKINRGK